MLRTTNCGCRGLAQTVVLDGLRSREARGPYGVGIYWVQHENKGREIADAAKPGSAPARGSAAIPAEGANMSAGSRRYGGPHIVKGRTEEVS